MELNDALAMVQTWIHESRAADRDIRGSMQAGPKGDFSVSVKGAIFRFNPGDGSLSGSGLIARKMKSFRAYPERWDYLVRTGRRESTTMMYGEAEFELVRERLFELDPDIVLLTKTYHQRMTDGRKLGVQIRWLLLDADYWFVNRFNEITAKPEAEIILEADGINAWMRKERPKPW